MSSHTTEIAIVGAGIVGLAHALAAAKRGYRVTVFERHPAAVGASIRNFGMIWPIGQPQGPLFDRALRARAIWQAVAPAAGIHLDPSGSLHLAYRDDEVAVLEEFMATTGQEIDTVKLLTASEVAEKSPAAITDSLQAALWSSTEMIVDPRVAIANLPAWLHRQYGVEFHFGTVVTEIDAPCLVAGGQTWRANHIFVCSGADFESLYPDVYAASGITKVKLQMMRTAPQPLGWRLGAALCGGLTLTHYDAFAHCPSLPQLKTRIEQETPHFPWWGIHVMVSQNQAGELIIGDSHEYGWNPQPFDRADINQYILEYLRGFAIAPSFDIAATWHGVYAKRPGHTEFIAHPDPQVTIVNALSGAGMTLSFGLAEEVVQVLLGPSQATPPSPTVGLPS
jgi:FAD dependent oxidoreductase TIGR03364